MDTQNKGFFSRLGGWLTAFRNFFLNLFFYGVLIGLVAASFQGDSAPEVPSGSALFLNPNGALVEQAIPVQFSLTSSQVRNIEIGSVIKTIEHAAKDDKIKLLVLTSTGLELTSAAQVYRIGEAINQFKESGKRVIAYGRSYSQGQYHLATYADAVYLHPDGAMMLMGYGGNSLFFKEMLDKLKIKMNVFRVGTFKSAVEPFISNEMSPAAKEANQFLYDGLWSEFVKDVAANRKLSTDDVYAYANDYAEVLKQTQGDMARAVLESNLVDELLTLDQIRVRIGDQVGWEDDEINQVDFDTYRALNQVNGNDDTEASDSDDVIEVIVAQGTIVESPMQGSMVAAADQLVEYIRDARNDDDVKALVLRVDSPGGSAFASELIRQELELFQVSGRPVVASFAGLAASGGYWISATADHIVTEPTTITGSIGIFGLFPSFDGTLEAIGVNADGVGTTPLTTADSPFVPINDTITEIYQTNIEYGYRPFINLVAKGRDMTPEAVDAIAQGRVWQGRKAIDLGLADQLGSIDEAIAHAAELAELDSWQTRMARPEVDQWQAMIQNVIESTGLQTHAPALPDWLQDTLQASQTLAPLLESEAPLTRYAMCLECIQPEL